MDKGLWLHLRAATRTLPVTLGWGGSNVLHSGRNQAAPELQQTPLLKAVPPTSPPTCPPASSPAGSSAGPQCRSAMPSSSSPAAPRPLPVGGQPLAAAAQPEGCQHITFYPSVLAPHSLSSSIPFPFRNKHSIYKPAAWANQCKAGQVQGWVPPRTPRAASSQPATNPERGYIPARRA